MPKRLIKMKSTARKCLEITSLFEAEILVELMLWRWEHPFAEDREFINNLLENASIALRNAADGEQLIDTVPAEELSLVAAVWYAERCAVESENTTGETIEARRAWLAMVQRALPSCFCDPSDLPEM